MHLVLEALGIGPGDEVVTPSLTWVSTVNLIELSGARPIFVDVDRETLQVTPQAVEAALSPRTRLVVPVHYAGAPVDLDPILDLCEARGVRVVQDAAHAVGTEYRGRPIGARGAAIFSFHPIKNMTTAEGGLITSDEPRLLERVRRLRFHGLGLDAFDRRTQGRKPQAEVLEPGFKYNLPDLCAALGLSQLARLDAMNARRAALATRYREGLAGIPGVRPVAPPAWPHRHANHLLVVRLLEDAALDRDAFMAAMGELGIGTGIHFRAVHGQRYYAERYPELAGTLPATEWNSERICSLPLFPDMTEEDVDRVLEAMRSVLGEPARVS
jgi:UDP-4-amino-4-deoxy-L-arabinose-oxoglutarate aminotransferase